MQAVTPVPSHQARSGFLLFWPFSSFRVEMSDGLIASCLIDGSMLWMNGSVAKVLRSTDVGRPRQHEARLGDVHLQLVLHLFLRAVDDLVDHAFLEAREDVEELGFVRPGAAPLVEADERALVRRLVGAMIGEEDRLGLEPVDGGAGDRGDLDDLIVLRGGEGDRGRKHQRAWRSRFRFHMAVTPTPV